MTLTQHPMRRGRGLQSAATDVISLTIGNYTDAPLNARKIDKNVYPTAANRSNILETDPIYLYDPSPRQDRSRRRRSRRGETCKCRIAAISLPCAPGAVASS